MLSTVSSMKTTLQDALDDVASTRSSFGRRNRALAVLEQQLALAFPSRLLAWIQFTEERDSEMNTTCFQLCQGLSIIQGVSLHHKQVSLSGSPVFP
ncbi:hypothetical protein BD769DRAFT_1495000 [Suillus cothurnatus]|nr:hypothetical protein BD769DRAFT_1495000 [Suillus cothurnatus]